MKLPKLFITVLRSTSRPPLHPAAAAAAAAAPNGAATATTTAYSRHLCTLPPPDTSPDPPSTAHPSAAHPSAAHPSTAAQNASRARLYLEKYASHPVPTTPLPRAPLTKRIPPVTGAPPGAPAIAALLETVHGAHAAAVLDVRTKAPFADWLVVCTARSPRHVRAVADGIKDDMRAAGVRVGGELVAICGRDSLDWMAVDVGAVVVHVMTEEARQVYDLESLWRPEKVAVEVEETEDGV